MNSISRERLDPSEIITEENILNISERITLRALRTVLSVSYNKRLNKLYIGINRDIGHFYEAEYIFSDGFDLVQTAACFLCEHIGERLDDACGNNKHGKPVTVHTACFNEVNRHIMAIRKESYMRASGDDPEVINLTTTIKDEEDDYTAADKLIEDMKLTESEKGVLSCDMSKLSLKEIAARLSIGISTIYLRRYAIRKKYLSLNRN